MRVWSAACSTGEEPFTLAMVLRHHLPPEEGWKVEILATDLSTRVLERVRTALWPVDKAREIPPHYLKQYMLRGVGSQEGWMKAGPELRELVRFQRLNLNSEQYAVDGRRPPAWRTMARGHLWVTADRIYGRYVRAHLPGGRVVPICVELGNDSDEPGIETEEGSKPGHVVATKVDNGLAVERWR